MLQLIFITGVLPIMSHLRRKLPQTDYIKITEIKLEEHFFFPFQTLPPFLTIL